MRNLRKPAAAERVSLATDAFALPDPPTSAAWGAVPEWWMDSEVVPEFELEVWGNAPIALTDAELFAASGNPLVVADDVFTADAGTNQLNAVAHGLVTGDGPLHVTTADTLPGGLKIDTDYWVVRIDNDNVQFATSLYNALSEEVVDITSVGTGAHTWADTADTQRLYWHSHGLIGPAGDGAVALTASKAYRAFYPHSHRAVAYALAATLDVSNPEAVSVAIWPRADAR